MVKINSNQFLTVSFDKTIKLWNLKEGLCEYTFSGHSERIYRGIAVFDENYFLSGGKDKKLIMWDY